MSAKVLTAMNELYNADMNFHRAREAVEDLQAGHAPDKTKIDEWNAAPAVYDAAIDVITNAPLPTFDKEQYAVSAAELADPNARPAAMARIEAYLNELNVTKDRTVKEAELLRGMIANLESAQADLKALLDFNANLASVPEFGDLFFWNWYDLEHTTRPAVGKAKAALITHLHTLEHEQTKLETYAANLAGNLNDLKAALADITGTWEKQGPSSKPWQAQFTRQGDSYTGTFTMFGHNYPLGSVNFNASRQIAFAVNQSGLVTSYSGTVSSDYRQMTLSEKTLGGSHVVTFIKK